jgi:hypothetical protein
MDLCLPPPDEGTGLSQKIFCLDKMLFNRVIANPDAE